MERVLRAAERDDASRAAAFSAQSRAVAPIDEALRARLRSLGYLGK